MALTRAFPLTPARIIELRLEAFNVMNWFELGQPNTTFNSPTFGQITTSGASLGNPPRILQLAVKYAF